MAPPSIWSATLASWSDEENAQLMRLVHQAFELRETPYLRDAVEAIVRWREDTLPDRIERGSVSV